jgi:CBS domain-containing protein
MRHRIVRDIMTGGAIKAQPPGATVRDASRLMAANNIGSVLVIDGDRLVGIFTERDALRRVLGTDLDPDLTPLADVMTRDPDTIGPEESVCDAIRRMDEFGYRHLPVVERGRIVGLISTRDCPFDELAAMAAELEDRQAIAERAW